MITVTSFSTWTHCIW